MHGNGRGGVLKYYPPGSIYRTVDGNFDPNVSWGGTWELLKDVFLVGAGNKYSIGSTGGEETHTITINEMPSHYHNGTYNFNANYRIDPSSYEGVFSNLYGPNDGQKGAITRATASEGGNQPHNNMPPYKAVNTWVRTS